MKRILVTNDDGFESLGLRALADCLREFAHVTVVAPTTEKSACGHSLTLTRPLKFIEIDDDFFKLDDGTPTDCIYLAMNALFKDGTKPDLIVSGINYGANMGEDITYSGTASGAMEGVIHGVPSIAFSQVFGSKFIFNYDFELAKHTAKTIVKKVLDGEFPLGDRKFLNVNIPPLSTKEFKGFKTTKAGYRHYGNSAHLNRNPRGEEYYWLGLHPLNWREEDGTDFNAIRDGYVSISPIHLDMTSHKDLEMLGSWTDTLG